MNIQSIILYVKEALSQPSGAVGIIGIATIIGVQIDKEQAESIQMLGLSLVSLIAAFVKW